MNRKLVVIGIIAMVIVVAGYFIFFNSSSSQVQNGKAMQGEKKVLYWRAPMDPNEIYDHPGKSKMGMDLVPVYENAGGAEGVVEIDPAVEQNMNLKTAVVEKKNLSSRVITNGILTTDEQREYIVTTRVNGWVEKLYVNYTGQVVKKGEKLMDIYSPELVAAEQEMLTALSYQSSVKNSGINEVATSGNELLKNAVRKLELLEIPDAEINRLKETKEVKTDITLYAQNAGTVIEKNVVEGQKIMAGMPLLHIADLSSLWLTADIYEYELNKIDVGSRASIKYNYLPGKTFEGRISFIYPTIDPKSRTAKIRIDINNSKGNLKPAMFANVEIEGKNLGDYPVVPENAVIRSGTKNIVVVALGDGKFKPQDVELGNYSDGYYQVSSGLTQGSRIVTSAQFLIDSESNLRSAIGQMQTSSSMDTTTQDSMKNINMEKPKEKEKTVSSSLIRKEPIDVKSIDKNGDGKVFQDVMDWNVISDKPGTCPICGMTLREFTVQKAKENLMEHGFKVK